MKRLLSVIVVFGFLILIVACATVPKQETLARTGPFKIQTVELTDMKTAPYLLNSINFKLQRLLSQKDLLYKPDVQKKYLEVELFISASYPAFIRYEESSSYSSLETKVVLKDMDGNVIKQGTITTINAFRVATSDFTEMDHVGEIVRFLTSP
jgi:hypothetical protein